MGNVLSLLLVVVCIAAIVMLLVGGIRRARHLLRVAGWAVGLLVVAVILTRVG